MIDNLDVFKLPLSLCHHDLLRDFSQGGVIIERQDVYSFHCKDNKKKN